MIDLSQYAHERDLQAFTLGDTIDIKAGLILASLTFLAIQSGTLSGSGMTLYQSIVQAVSIIAVVSGGVLTVLVLWPRNYEREAAPDKYDAWISETAVNSGSSAI